MSKKLHEFLPAIKKLSKDQPLTKKELLVDPFLVEKEGDLNMYYAPHNEYINHRAKIIIVGITPGWNQMKTAFEKFLESVEQHQNTEQLLKEVKKAASFSGSMRSNLIGMLDEIGVHKALHINSSASLFAEKRNLLHTTSIIKYPVFFQGKNYTGHRPSIHQSPLLSKYAFEIFPEELNQIQPPALVIPLGNTVEKVLRQLLEEGKLPKHYYLFGFPHPSGANGHRKRQLQEQKERLVHAIREWGKQQ